MRKLKQRVGRETNQAKNIKNVTRRKRKLILRNTLSTAIFHNISKWQLISV